MRPGFPLLQGGLAGVVALGAWVWRGGRSLRPVPGKAPDRELFEMFEAVFGNRIGL
jgi:hypothetical protein